MKHALRRESVVEARLEDVRKTVNNIWERNMSLMNIRLELGRTQDTPEGDRRHGYEFIAPLDRYGHLDAAEWDAKQDKCGVRCFRPSHADRRGMFRRVGRGWKFDYFPDRRDDDEPIFRLDRHIIAPGLYISITEEDGVQRPFKIATVTPVAP